MTDVFSETSFGYDIPECRKENAHWYMKNNCVFYIINNLFGFHYLFDHTPVGARVCLAPTELFSKKTYRIFKDSSDSRL